MTKNNKLRTGIFALAMMLMCSPQTWAQSGKAAAPSAVSTTPVVQKNSAKADLENFKANSPIPQLNEKRKEVLTSKAELEKAQMAGKLTPAQVAEAKAKIANMEQEMQPMVTREQQMLGITPTPAPQTTAKPVRQQQPQQQKVVATPEQIAPVNSGRALTPAEVELKNFKPDAQNPQLNNMRMDLLRVTAELEVGQMEKTFTPQQISEYKTKISLMQADIQKFAAKQASTK